jgi:cytochrome b
MRTDGADSLSLVWDFPLRVFHWGLVVAVTLAGVSGFMLPPTWLNLHVYAGAVIAALLLFRLAWGFTGTTFSRFRSFFFSPAATLSYARAQLAGTARHFTGHNPLGAAMIFALIITLLALVVTGATVLGGTEKQGPLRAIISFAQGRTLREIHQAFAWFLLVLVAGHLSGVILESIRTRINLPRSMITGLKPRVSDEPPVAASPMLALAIFAALTGAIGSPAYALWQKNTPQVPSAPLDADYAVACGDCHVPYHPSLRSAKQWGAIMKGLDDHFGENAALDATQAAAIADYLATNSAEHWDTRAANVFRDGDKLAITESDFWQRRHRKIFAATFTSKAVGAKSNCEACHADARGGLFAAQSISIPQEITP